MIATEQAPCFSINDATVVVVAVVSFGTVWALGKMFEAPSSGGLTSKSMVRVTVSQPTRAKWLKNCFFIIKKDCIRSTEA